MTDHSEVGDAGAILTVSLHRPDETTVIVSCVGDLDMVTAPALERRIDEALDEQPAALIIDLTAVDFLASHGMGILIGTHNLIRDRIAFTVVADGPATSRPLTMLGLDSEFALHPDLESAMAALKSRSHD